MLLDDPYRVLPDKFTELDVGDKKTRSSTSNHSVVFKQSLSGLVPYHSSLYSTQPQTIGERKQFALS